MESARATLYAAKAQRARFRRLLEDGLVSQRDYEVAERDGARLLVVRPTAEGGGGATETSDRMITDLPALLPEGALLIVNDTRVLPARLFGTKPSGGRVELLLIERDGPPSEERERWTALARASKPLRAGLTIAIDGGELQATLLAGRHEDGHVSIELVPRPGQGECVKGEPTNHAQTNPGNRCHRKQYLEPAGRRYP